MAVAQILLVDDSSAVREALSLALEAYGHEVVSAADGPTALAALRTMQQLEVMVLDVMMPTMDGFEVCRRVRAIDTIPIIMLTARTDPVDVVVGLESGADDYVAKPVEPRVLDARIKAVLRRAAPSTATDLVRVGDLSIDLAGMVVSRAGQEIALTPTERRLLIVLVRNAGQVLTREVLLDRVWDYDHAGDSRLVDATIQRLRAKVETDPARPSLIRTVRGLGYRIDAA